MWGWHGELSPLGTFFSGPKASKMPKHVFPRKASARLLKACLLQIDFIGVYVCVCVFMCGKDGERRASLESEFPSQFSFPHPKTEE